MEGCRVCCQLTILRRLRTEEGGYGVGSGTDQDVVVVLSAGIELSKNDGALEILALGKRRIIT